MRTIARDEMRHAALSWSVARWAWRLLSRDARDELVDQCRIAIAALRRDACETPSPEVLARAGFPTSDQRRAFIDVLEAELWAEGLPRKAG
jgi:hypothetical protein